MIEDDPTNSGPLATYLDSHPRKLSLTPPIERANVTTHQPDNHKMKPTEDQVEICRETYRQHNGDGTASWTKAIEKWEEIRSADPEIEALHAEVAALKASLPEWIPVAERRPTVDDADNYDYVLWLTKGVIGHQKWNMAPKDDFQPTHWMSLDSVVKLPKRPAPTPEEIEQKALDAAWEETCGTKYRHDGFDLFEAGWKAARAK